MINGKPKIVITGGLGFIGSHALRQFIDLKRVGTPWEIVVIDKKDSDEHKTRDYQLVVADINDYDGIQKFFEGADLVWHLAAEINIPESIMSPRKTFETNVLGTANVLQAAKKWNVPRVVFASTCAVDQVDTVKNPYAVSKAMGEELCRMYSDLYELDVVIASFYNVYGSGQPSDGPYAPVIAKFLDAIRFNKDLYVFGDGEQTRDFIHVSDVINAMMTLSLPKNRFSGECFPVGTGESVSINELIDMIDPEKRHPMYVNLPARPAEIRHSQAMPKRLLDLGWKPQVELSSYLDNLRKSPVAT